jgi:hypothetical protein
MSTIWDGSYPPSILHPPAPPVPDPEPEPEPEPEQT